MMLTLRTESSVFRALILNKNTTFLKKLVPNVEHSLVVNWPTSVWLPQMPNLSNPPLLVTSLTSTVACLSWKHRKNEVKLCIYLSELPWPFVG